MKKFLIYFCLTITVGFLVSIIYWLSDYEIPGIFTHKLQFISIPGFIYLAVAAYIHREGSVTFKREHFTEVDTIDQVESGLRGYIEKFDGRTPVFFAFFLSGIILLGFSVLLLQF